MHVGDGEAHVVQTRNVFAAGVGEVAARHLGAAFQQVAGHRGAGQQVPVVALPAEVRDAGPQRQRRVGHAPGDHHLRAGPQRVGNFEGAQVHVGADEAVFVEATLQPVLRPAVDSVFQRVAQRLAVLGAAQVVALDHRDARRRQALFCRHARNAGRCAQRIGSAEVAYDGDAMPQTVGQHGAQGEFEQRLEAARRVGPPCQVRQGQRAFGKHLEDQRRRAAAPDQRGHHRARCIHAVAGEAGTAADGNGGHRAGHRARHRHAASMADVSAYVNKIDSGGRATAQPMDAA